MLVMFTHGGTAETVEIMCHIANLQLIVAGAILFWLLEGAGAKISKVLVLVLVYVFDAMVSIFLAFIFGRALLFHYCTHEGRSQHSVADMRVHCYALLNFGVSLSLEDLPIQRKPAKAFFPSNVPFFAEGRPDGARKYGKMRPKYGNIVQFDTTLWDLNPKPCLARPKP